MMKRAHRPSGFTLVESVVALAILALTLGVVYESFGWSLRRTAGVEKREAAWLTAQSLLASIRGRSLLREGSERGDGVAGLKWETHIAPAAATIDPQSAVQPFEVTIDVSWGSRPAQRITLRSVETGRVTL
jgi:prepilin-type N-terminal cleavage/methylation domain